MMWREYSGSIVFSLFSGSDVSEKLQKAKVRFLPDDSCVNQYANEQKLRNGYDKKLMVCAGDEYSNKDTCTVGRAIDGKKSSNAREYRN